MGSLVTPTTAHAISKRAREEHVVEREVREGTGIKTIAYTRDRAFGRRASLQQRRLSAKLVIATTHDDSITIASSNRFQRNEHENRRRDVCEQLELPFNRLAR